jgi:hypothetical protein
VLTQAQATQVRLAEEKTKQLQLTVGVEKGYLRRNRNLPNFLLCVSVSVRLWDMEGSAVDLPCADGGFKALCGRVQQEFDLQGTYRLYYIPNKRDFHSRTEVHNDETFAHYLKLTKHLTLLIFVSGTDSKGSPTTLPVHESDGFRSVSEENTHSSSAHAMMTKAVRRVCENRCRVTKEELKFGSKNVDNAHIMGVKTTTESQKIEAGLGTAYDTCNGILMSKVWHTTFDDGKWCMDEHLVIHLGDELKEDDYFKPYEGKSLYKPAETTDVTWPNKKLLRYRFKLWQDGKISNHGPGYAHPS